MSRRERETVNVLPRLAAAAALLLAGSAAEAAMQRDQYPWEEMQQHSLEVTPGGALLVRVDDADVAVTVSTGDRAEVALRLRSNDMEWARDRFERTQYRVRIDRNTVVVESGEEPRNSWRAGNWMSVLVEVAVPARFDLDVETQDGDVSVGSFNGNARLRSQDGDLIIEALSGGDIELRTQDGDVRASVLSGPSVSAVSQDGDIEVDALSGSVSMRTQDGDIRIGAAEIVAIDLASGDGDIHLGLMTSDASLDLRTSDGDISIEAPATLRADIDLSGEDVYIGGGFAISGRVTSGRADGNINGGGAQVRARAGDGTVRLVAR